MQRAIIYWSEEAKEKQNEETQGWHLEGVFGDAFETGALSHLWAEDSQRDGWGQVDEALLRYMWNYTQYSSS